MYCVTDVVVIIRLVSGQCSDDYCSSNVPFRISSQDGSICLEVALAFELPSPSYFWVNMREIFVKNRLLFLNHESDRTDKFGKFSESGTAKERSDASWRLSLIISICLEGVLAVRRWMLTAEREDWNPLVFVRWWGSGPSQWWDCLWGASPSTCWSGVPTPAAPFLSFFLASSRANASTLVPLTRPVVSSHSPQLRSSVAS